MINKIIIMITAIGLVAIANLATAQTSDQAYIANALQRMREAPAKRLKQLRQSFAEQVKQKQEAERLKEEGVPQEKITAEPEKAIIQTKPAPVTTYKRPAKEKQLEPQYDSTINIPSSSDSQKNDGWQYGY